MGQCGEKNKTAQLGSCPPSCPDITSVVRDMVKEEFSSLVGGLALGTEDQR